jgi:hypothetical protein
MKKTILSRVGDFFTSTLFKRFCWNTLAGFLAVLGAYLAGFSVTGNEAIMIAFGVAIVNNITKELNSYISNNY